MSLKDLKINSVYRSYGEDTISDMINPALSKAVYYKRSVGFFSSSSLKITASGINQLVNNNGKIQFIASPHLSDSDKKAIELGYKIKEDIIQSRFIEEFEKTIMDLEDSYLSMLAELIAAGIMEIKIVKTRGLGDYHDKFAILEDSMGNIISFNGSSNESQNGLCDNYERIFVFKSWETSNLEFVNDDISEFNELWSGTNKFNETYSFTEAIEKSIIKVRENRGKIKAVLQPYDYQQEAIKAWENNGYNGFYVMATGTGKTLTALFGLQRLMETGPLFTVIIVPYRHLIAQWEEDVKKIFPDTTIIEVSSDFPGWDNKMKNFLMFNNSKETKKSVIVISTIISFYSEKFNSASRYNKMDNCLIVDEAHNFINKIYDNKYFINYNYKLGLSATPVFGANTKKTDDLLEFFGGEVYSLPIEKAIGKYLVNYEYYPIFINSTDADERNFKYQTQRMMASIKNGVIVDEEEYSKAYRARLRCISMAENKIINLENIIKQIDAHDHFIVYCSDGRGDDDAETRHLNIVIRKLINLGYDPSQFTAKEDMHTRMNLIDAFNKGDIHTLAAIRCLDEGINIPSITKALILSSNNNYREFVQRRGRILRKYKDKKIAYIYDVIVLPTHDCIDIAKIELKRFNEYAKVALNKEKLELILNKYLNLYGLSYSDILFENEYITGGDLDD